MQATTSRADQTGRARYGHIRACCAVLSALVALACAGSKPPPPPYVPPAEWLAFEFDGRDWKAGERTRNAAIAQEVFVLPGETPKEWTELVTVSLSFGAQRGVDLKTVLMESQKALEKECPAIVWTTLLVEKRDALFEWSRPNCKKEKAQHEIVRISLGKLGIHRLTYQARKQDLASGLRRQWVETLRNAKLGPREPEPTAPGSSGD